MKSLEYSRLFLFPDIPPGQLVQTDAEDIRDADQGIDIGDADLTLICGDCLPADIEFVGEILLAHSMFLAELSYIVPNCI